MHLGPFLSVIIPTFNRAAQLERCLDALKNQSLVPDGFEIIVVDDGSTDSTEALLKEKQEKMENLFFLHQKNSGQGNARNHGLEKAHGQIVLFIGDDIYGTSHFLEEHLKFHQENPEIEAACLGLTLWDSSKPVTPFMEWLTHGGPQFAYHQLEPGQEVSFWHFYTSNLSLKKDMMSQNKFDPDFRGYGWEDVELGYRLVQSGLKLIYTPSCLAVHDHLMEESSLKDRMFKIGKNALIFQRKQPEVDVVPRASRKFLLFILSSVPVLSVIWILKSLRITGMTQLYWFLLSKHYFLKGIADVEDK